MNKPPATATTALFHSAHSAASFAYRYSSQQYGRSPLAKLMASPTGSGKGLAGVDGAAQAGMIRRLVHGMGPLHEAIITARFTPRDSVCACGSPCCSGRSNNSAWTAAVRNIGDLAVMATPCAVSNSRLRYGVVAKHFGADINISELADQCRVHRNTASKHSALILTWLQGKPATPERTAVTGEEGKALLELNEILQRVGLVE